MYLLFTVTFQFTQFITMADFSVRQMIVIKENCVFD